VDAFHLDLCGTIAPSLEAARRVVPLVVKSRGRCLAITVADARRNLSVEKQFGRIESRLSKLLGFRYERMRERLLAERAGDRQLAVMRELAFFYHLIDLLKFYGRYAVPKEVIRYSYVSYTSGAPFAMRTYFFHFEEEPQRMSADKFAQLLYSKWVKGPVVDLNNKPTLENVGLQESDMSNTESKYEKLRSIAEAVGGDALAQFHQLVADAASGAKQSLAHARAKLQEIIADLDPSATIGSAPSASPAASGKRKYTLKKRGKAKKAGKGSGAPAVLPQNGERVDAQVLLLKAAAKSPKKLEKTKLEVARGFKLSRNKSKGYIVGGLYAHTQGKHRVRFIGRLHKHNPALLNDELAACYTAITGKKVTLAELRQEAGIK
jgi:hypothetical protein